MSLTVPTYIRSSDTDLYQAILGLHRGAWTEFVSQSMHRWEKEKQGQVKNPSIVVKLPVPLPKTSGSEHTNYLKKGKK